MNRVTIQFKSEQDMRDFYTLCEIPKAVIDVNTLTILCYCEQREIELATNGFDAKILRKEIVYN